MKRQISEVISQSSSPTTKSAKLDSKNPITFISWNVAGLAACMKKGFAEYVSTQDPDFLCIQETKMNQTPIQPFLPIKTYPFQYQNNSKTKKGYSGTLIATKYKPLNVKMGIGKPEFDDQGRIITLEYNSFYLINAYIPNAGQKLERLQYKQDYALAMETYISQLELVKPVIYSGDLNVAHEEIDLTNPKTNQKTAGFTPQERFDFTRLLSKEKIDVFRYLHPESREYTYYGYRNNSRAKNIGWRLDYFVISKSLLNRIVSCEIQKEVVGSDHVPLILKVDRELLEEKE